MASNMAFNILLDADGTKASAEIDNLHRELDELSGKTIGLDVSKAEFDVKVREIKAQLDELSTKHPNIDVRVEATEALAKLAALDAAADKINGKRVALNVDDGGSAEKSTNDIRALMAAGIALGPAIIPVAAAVAAALGAIGTGAVIGLAAIGTGVLAFHGMSDAVKELGTAQQDGGAKAASAAAQHISSANGIANAQDSLRSAIANVGVAQENAGRSIRQALEQEQSARYAVTQAIQSEGNAEQSLTDAQQAAARAQQDLTQARTDAQRQLQDMGLSLEDNALAQRRAAIDLANARTALSNVTATDPRRAGLQLSLDEQLQRQKELQIQGQRLASDKATADAKGVDGSKQVTSAQDALAHANERVVSAQQALADSIHNVATAQQHERDSIEAVTVAREQGTRAVESAQQSVITAQRALQSAQASAAAQADSAAAAQRNLMVAYDQLTPAGQRFAHFVHDELEPKIKGLQATAQSGLLPGVEQGLKNMLPVLPQIDGLVGTIAHTLGDVAANTGAALNSPFWRGFIEFIKGEADPSIRIFSTTMGNLAQGGAAVLMAFKPVWDQMGAGIQSWSQHFADASKNLANNPEFQKFLTFVHDYGPLVMTTLGDIVVMFVRLGQAVAPVGVVALSVIDEFAKLVSDIPTPVLTILAATFVSVYTAMTLVRTGMLIGEAVYKGFTAAQWALNIAMDANPLVLIATLLAALVVGVIYAYNHFQTFRNIVNDAWTTIKFAASLGWDVLKYVFDRFMDAVHAIGQAFSNVAGWIRDTWSAIKDYAKIPIQFVIDVVYNNGILPVWNGIASVFGLHTLGPVHLATGGVLPGYNPGRDTVPAMLSPGEGVLVPEAVKALGPGFVHWANSEFSGGRVTRPSTGGGYADGGIVGDIAGIFTDPLGTVRRLFGGVFDAAGRIPGSGLLTEAMKGLPGKLVDAIVAKAKDLITSMASAGGGSFGGGSGVDQWTQVTLACLAQMGQPASLLGTTLRRMNQESGGNPTAVNRSDINWQHGTPSVGLMQVIGPTYAANKVIDRGPYLYGVSVDPAANILSSMHYAIGRYGSLASAYNRPGGYANGGIVTSPTMALVGEAGPEAILPLNRPHRAGRLAAQAGLGGATVNVGPVHVHSDVDVDVLAHRLAFASSAAGL